jgi:superfamily I DNA and/or RNA helicase
LGCGRVYAQQSRGFCRELDGFEGLVIQSMDSIETSTFSNRRGRIKKFLSYSDKVYGTLSRKYYAFAYQYPYDKNEGFFSGLAETDTLLLNDWAKVAKNELSNEAFGKPQKELVINNYGKEFMEKSSILKPKGKKLAFWYVKKLMSYAIAEYKD